MACPIPTEKPEKTKMYFIIEDVLHSKHPAPENLVAVMHYLRGETTWNPLLLK